MMMMMLHSLFISVLYLFTNNLNVTFNKTDKNKKLQIEFKLKYSGRWVPHSPRPLPQRWATHSVLNQHTKHLTRELTIVK